MPDDIEPAAPVPDDAMPDHEAPHDAVPDGAAAGDMTQAVPASPPGGGAGDITQAVTTSDAATTAVAASDAPSAPSPPRARKPRMSRPWLVTLVAVVVLLAGAGVALAVSSKTPTKPGKSAAAPNIPVTTAAPSGPPCPLTGLPAPGTQVPQRPALAVKVDNYPQARPQSGLGQADVVFEEPVEGGITRLVAVFQCQSPPQIGPIRSARAVDVQILDQLSRPLFFHAGGIDPVLALVRDGDLINDDVFAHGSVVHGIGRVAPYNTYMSAAAGWAVDPHDTTPPSPLFTYSTAAPTGSPVTGVHIPFAGTNNTFWSWDSSTKLWQLSYGSTPATTADGNRITTTNIVVQTVHVSYGPWAENSEGGLEVQSQMTGSGPLMVLRDGELITGTWHRGTLDEPTTLTASDGSQIALEPGPTWIEIVPSTVTVTTTASSGG